jgi:uncharacterized Zn-binding protein involved in type VI secretion
MPPEPTERDRIVEEALSEINLPQLGTVTKVWEHTEPDDDSNHEVNVLLRDEDMERRRVPIATPVGDMIAPPREDDTVLVQFLDGIEDAPVVTHVLYNDIDRAPLGTQGTVRLKRGSVYIEVHPDGDYARIAQKDTDDADPNAEIEIDDSGGNTVVNVNADTVKLAGGGNPVARKGDSVEVDDPDSGTLTGQITGGSQTTESG